MIAYTYINGARVRLEIDFDFADLNNILAKATNNVLVNFDYLASRVAKVEARQTNILGHGGMHARLDLLTAVYSALSKGQKIQAIKALREATPGLGLKEAKETIEKWSAEAEVEVKVPL